MPKVNLSPEKHQKVINIQHTLIKAKVLKEFLSELTNNQTTELNNMASEVIFYESTLKNIKSAVKKLRKVRDGNVRDFISDRITMISKSARAMSVAAGSDI